jgi:hypothetical protein
MESLHLSSIAKKLIMSISGLFLILFLTLHVTINLVAVFSLEVYDAAVYNANRRKFFDNSYLFPYQFSNKINEHFIRLKGKQNNGYSLNLRIKSHLYINFSHRINVCDNYNT